MKKIKKNKIIFLLFSVLALTTGVILTVVSCTSENVIKDEKELTIKKSVNSIELSQSEFDILKPKSKNGVVTEQVKTILDKIFFGIDSTNISKILFNLNETETKIIITPIESYYFEGKLNILNVLYTVKTDIKDININVSIKEITEKIQEKDIQNILGSIIVDKISSLNKLFTGIDHANINFFDIEKINDNNNKPSNIKLIANKGYIFNNTSASLTSNKFTIDSGVLPPIVENKKLNITAKKAVEGIALTEPDLRAIYKGDTSDEEKLSILTKVFDGIDLNNIKHIKSDYVATKNQIFLTTAFGYSFSDGSTRLDSVVFPEAQKVLINVTAKTGKIVFADQDAEDMKSKNNDLKLAVLSKVFDGFTKDNIKGINEPLLGNNRNTIFIFRSYGYLFPNDKTQIESNIVTGISKLVYIKPLQNPSGVFQEDFKNIKDPIITRKEKINIFLKFFKPESNWFDEFDSVNIKSIADNKITLEAKPGFIFLRQTPDGPNVREITSNTVTSFSTAPQFLNIGLVPKTPTITSTDIADLTNPSKKLAVLNKYFTGITSSNINHFSADVNTYKTIITLKANSGYSLGKFIQISNLDSWWNLPEKGTNPTTGANPVSQWMPRQQTEVEAAPVQTMENLDASNRPFKWLSATPQKPNDFPTNLSPDEQKIVDFYKNTTARISLPVWDGDDEYSESGTIWNYPKPEWDKTNDWTYFGTNIHVITNDLVKTIPAGSTQKPVHGFYLKEDIRHKDIRLNFTRDKQASINDYDHTYWADVSKGEIELVDLALNTSADYDINGTNRNMLDYAIIRVKTIGKDGRGNRFDIKQHINKQNDLVYDWIDTEAEFEEVFKDIENMTFYVGGYPKGFWTIKSYTRNQFWVPQTSTSLIKSGSIWYTDPNFSKYDAVKLGGQNGEEWYNMSNNLMFPNFPIGPGSSGSLITIIHKGKIRPVAIFWGEFASFVSDNLVGNKNIIPMSGADLFYTPNYFFKSQTNSVPGYDFTKVKTPK
ncbi:MAG: hypothetical protein ACRDAW_02220 [Metamycoplasmataceae bacterium]